jgi:hypothetical protein
MYSTCLFCHTDLGANEAVEHFPVGRRLAFDAAKGRLWVVCRRCERWNLTPIEDRWEAIEECERSYRGTKLRVSTDQIGLARLDEGLELVRIGQPLRPEFAAWRYGDQFGRRRRKNIVRGVAIAAGAITIPWLGPALGLSLGGFGGLIFQLSNLSYGLYSNKRVVSASLAPASAPRQALGLKYEWFILDDASESTRRTNAMAADTVTPRRLKHLAEAMGCHTQQDLARALGITQARVSQPFRETPR